MMNSRSKINVLLLTDCMPDLMGGAERQIYELAKSLDKNRFNVTVASLECVGQAPRHLIERIGCRFVGFRVKRIYGVSGLVQGIRFWRFLKKERIHVLQTYHFGSDIWGTVCARFAGVKYVISSRRDMGFWRKPRQLKAYLWVNRWVNTIVTNCKSIKEYVISTEGVAEEKIKVIYNGIDINMRPPAERPDSKDGLTVMHVANLTPVKGHRYLLKAFAGIVQERPDVKLVLIGEGPMRNEITNLITALELQDNVTLLGKREDARVLLEQADICVLPSFSEGMSNAILEYMAAGKSVVATRVGGNPELVMDGKSGILVDPRNPEQIREALSSLINDAAKRAAMGQEGLRRIKKHFSMSAMVNAYDRLLTDAAQRQNPRVCHLVSSGGLFGAERVILNLAKSNHEHSFIGAIHNTHNPHLEILDEGKKMGLQTIAFDSNGRFDMSTVLQIRRFLKDKGIDVVHTHNYKSDTIGYLATRFSRTQWIATAHGWLDLENKLRFYEFLDALVLRFAARIAAVSHVLKKELVARCISADKINVIDNGIDVSLFDRDQPAERIKSELGINKDEIVVAIVGRLSPEKGHTIFLKAAREVLQKKSDVKFLIIGDGPIKEKLQSESRRFQLNGNVVFAGFRSDMRALYAITDIMVNASTSEGLPMTILEAMASKVALIVTPVGAVPQVIHNRINGIIVNTGDHENLSKAICALIDQPGLRKDLIERAYGDVCKKFDLKTMASRYDKVYRQVLSTNQ